MGTIDNARLMLTKCRNCLGCNRLESETFRGDDKCKNHRNALMEGQKELSSYSITGVGHTKGSQKDFTAARGR